MKKIEMIVKGAPETLKAQFKERRIRKALEAARLNAEEDLESAKADLAEFSDKDGNMNAEDIVNNLAILIRDCRDAEETLKILDEVEAYLNTEVAE